MNMLFVASLIAAMLALVGVFIEIPVVSNFAFWGAHGGVRDARREPSQVSSSGLPKQAFGLFPRETPRSE